LTEQRLIRQAGSSPLEALTASLERDEWSGAIHPVPALYFCCMICPKSLQLFGIML
jgi:hypothetical protein